MFAGCGADNLCGTASKELKNAACVVEMAVREDDVVLSPAAGVEGLVVVCFDRAIF